MCEEGEISVWCVCVLTMKTSINKTLNVSIHTAIVLQFITSFCQVATHLTLTHTRHVNLQMVACVRAPVKVTSFTQ